MRLLRLDFRAIGPFIKEHSIDFTAFENDGLYLLRGETGAGKSTLIDAITYALYGRVAGGTDSSKERLRSNYASDNDESYVRLRFEVGQGVFEVERSPEYHKAGRKSAIPAKAVLSRLTLDEDGQCLETEPISQRIGDINSQVQSLLGVDYHQFLQTVVLPQGKFAEFIQAKSDERKAILSAIFATAQFEAFQDRLLRRWKDVNAELSSQLSNLEFIAATVSDKAAENAAAGDWEGAVAAGVAQVTNHQQVWETKNAERHQHALAVYELAALEAEATAIAQFQAREKQVQQKESELDAQRPQVEQLRRQLEASLSAQPVKVAHRQLQQTERSLQAEESNSAQLLQALADAGNPVDPQQVDAHWDQLQAQIQVVDTTREAAQECDRTRDELLQVNQQLESLDEQLQTQQGAKERLDAQLPVMTQNVQILRQMAQPGVELQSQVQQLKTTLALVAEAETKRAELVALSEQINPAARKADSARRLSQSVTQRWLAASAAAIAEHLEPDQPCPVCGSTVHPAPQVPSEDHATQEQVEAAQAALQEATSALQELQLQQRDLTSAISGLNQQVGGQDRATLQFQLEQQEAALAQALEAGEKASALEEILQVQRNSLAQLVETMAQQGAQRSALAQKRTDLRGRVEALEARVSENLAGFDTLEARSLALQKLKDLMEQLRRGLATIQTLRSHRNHALEQMEQALSDTTFPDLESCLAAALEDEQQFQLQAQISSFDQEMAGVQARRAELDASDLRGRVGADSAALRGLLRKAKGRAERALQAETAAAKELEAAQTRLHSLQQALLQYQQKRAGSESLQRLAEAARGAALDEGRRISLDTWVLLNQFDDVIAAANPHLLQFSAQRYQLKRTVADAGSQTQYAGLGLAILDEEADGERTPSSLSGGEKFYTSLALALGLVEVISSYAGGLQFRSMIIDEGFGSLDYSRLDDVMAGLEAMQTSGRTVGVVSHVTEMRNRIQTGVEVTRLSSGKGSTLKVYGDDL